MVMVACTCPQCGCAFLAETGQVNRAKRSGSPKYCGRICSGLGRRNGKTQEQKRNEKSEYDRARRKELADRIKAEKAAYYQRTKDPIKEAAKRKYRMPRHLEYCRRPEYREWKRKYDEVYRAKTKHGEFWESAILALEIRRTCLELSDDTEIRRQKGTLNKHQNRRRNYDRTHSNKSEIGALGNVELS